MSTDCRSQFIRSIENSLIEKVTPDVLDVVMSKILMALNDYEIIDRCTDVAVYDDSNFRIMKRYFACLMIDGKSEKTIEQYRYRIGKFVEFTQKPLAEIGVYDIRYYLACEKERGVSTRTLENTRAVLSAFFQWMAIEEIVQKNPCLNIKPIKYKREVKKPFSNVEIDKLRICCGSKRNRALVEFLLTSGVRISELTSMKVSDVDMEKMTVHVRNGKGNKERFTFINDVAKMHLLEYLKTRKEDGSYLFYSKNHTPITASGVRDMLRKLGEKSGVESVHPHRFRRTFATNLANRGMKVQEIQKLLGHSNINTTMCYVCTDEKHIQMSYTQHIA